MISLLGRSRRHDIIVRRTGMIDITARVARILQLAPGDSIDILVDNNEYYLTVVHHASGGCGCFRAVARPTKKGKHFRVHSTVISRALLAAVENPIVARLAVGQPIRDQQQRVLIPIITRYTI